MHAHAHICNNYTKFKLSWINTYCHAILHSGQKNRLHRLQVDLGGIPGASVSVADAEFLTVGRIFILCQRND